MRTSSPSQRLHRMLLAAIVALGLSNIAMAATVVSTRSREAALVVTGHELTTELRQAVRDRRGLESVLTSLPLSDGPAVVGREALADSIWTLGRDARAVVYVLDTNCPACELNLPVLDGWSKSGGVVVVGISFHDGLEALHDYATARDISFPLLSAPTGTLVPLVPRHGTPVTIFLANGHAQAIVSGSVNSLPSSW